MMLSNKSEQISESLTLAISAKEKKLKSEGFDVIGFGAGEPDFDTPDYIKEAAIKAIQDGFTKYTPVSGTQQLREAICEKLLRDNGLSYSPTQIVVSNGAKHSLFNAFQTILNPGDEVIIQQPYWLSYPELVKLADGIPVFIKSDENTFKNSIEDFKNAITKRTKAIILNSPSNPTGAFLTKDELQEIADLAVENNIFVISDEIYEKIIYDGEVHISIASLNQDIKDLTILVNGLSKSHSMTGWRIGYTASNKKIADIMSNIQSHATSNANSIAQYASTVALNEDDGSSIKKMVLEFDKRRNYICDRINSIPGLSCVYPKGAFYVMMNISDIIGTKIKGYDIKDSLSFSDALLDYSKVAVVPGIVFGDDRFVRLSYATSMDNIQKGLDRIEDFVK